MSSRSQSRKGRSRRLRFWHIDPLSRFAAIVLAARRFFGSIHSTTGVLLLLVVLSKSRFLAGEIAGRTPGRCLIRPLERVNWILHRRGVARQIYASRLVSPLMVELGW